MPAHQKITRVAFVGNGNIAGPYANCLKRHPELQLAGVFDLDDAKRAAFAKEHECSDYGSLDELCSDAPDIVVNLTSAPYHFATTKELIGRGQTVFSEKPLAMTYAEAEELVDLANTHNVRLACAPSVWLGEAQMRVAKEVLDGAAGAIKLVNAEVNQGRIESWHPAPETFYKVGPVFDAGVYPLAYVTAILGPIRSVQAISAVVLPDRKNLAGQSFEVATPDAWLIIGQFESGQLLRLSCNFFVQSATVSRAVEFHGVTGSVRLDDWIMPGAASSSAVFGEEYAATASASELALDWALGVKDLAAAIQEDRPHRITAEHAAHIVEVLEAIDRAAASGTRVQIQSSFTNPLADLSEGNSSNA